MWPRMKTVAAMLRAHPHAPVNHTDVLSDALEHLALCGQVCLICADACLAEKSPEMLRDCIRLNLDCAAICGTTAELLLRRADAAATGLHAQLHACIAACQACADMCESHAARHQHCAICAEACRDCQEKCNIALAEYSSEGVVGSD